MVKKWYIWLSFPAFAVLGSLTMLQCLVPRKGCLLLMIKFQIVLTVLSIGIVMLPIVMNEIVTRSLFWEILMWVSLYVIGVIATYLLECWRERNLPHLIKQNQGEVINGEQGDGEDTD